MDFRLVSITLGQILCMLLSLLSILMMMIGFAGVMVDKGKQNKVDKVHLCLSFVSVIGHIATMKLLLALERMLP